MRRYYPGGYYAHSGELNLKRANLFKILQGQSIIQNKRNLLAKLIAWKYRPPDHYLMLKELEARHRGVSILDVGSGAGQLLSRFYHIGYTDLTGIDPYIESDITYDNSFRIEKKTVFELNRNFDIIMLHHSLEHMDQQLEVLKKLHQHLNNNGNLLIRIPVVSEPLMKRYGKHVVSLDPPRHFYIHTIQSFTQLAVQAGFRIVKTVYDAHEFSFWGSEQYSRGISLHNHPESFLVKKIFSDEQLNAWKREIRQLNEAGQSDNVAIYLRKSG